MSPRIRWFLFLALGSFVAMIALSVAGSVAESRHWLDDPALAERAEWITIVVSFALFLVLGFSLVPLMIRLFVAGQQRIGNGDRAPIRWLAAHEVGFARGVWAIYGIGLAIASPQMVRDLRLEAVQEAEGGVLVARVGMPLAEVRRRSTLALGEGAPASDAGARTFTGSPVFAFEIADAGLRFEGCTYYFVLTGEGADARVVAISIGLSSEVLGRPALDAAQRDAEQRLAAAGWLAGRYEGEVPEPQATRETSSFWRKGETVLQLDARRVDALAPGEDPATAGAWIQTLELRPPDAFAGLLFEPTTP